MGWFKCQHELLSGRRRSRQTLSHGEVPLGTEGLSWKVSEVSSHRMQLDVLFKLLG